MSLQQQNDNNDTLLDVFEKFEKRIFSKLKASSLARFEAITKDFDDNLGYGKILVKPMPLLPDQNEYSLEVYCIANMSSVTPGTVVPLCFTDMDFRNSLENNTIVQDSNGLYHKQSFGLCLYQNSSCKTADEEDIAQLFSTVMVITGTDIVVDHTLICYSSTVNKETLVLG